MLASASGMIPVVTFSVGVTNLQAEEVTLELGLRRRAVGAKDGRRRRD